jgi:hypothetical protein
MEIKLSIIRNRRRVQSANVKAWKYDTEFETLEIEFNDGSKYLYEFVSFEEYTEITEGRARCKTEGENQYGKWFVGKTPSVGAAVYKFLVESGKMFVKLNKNDKVMKLKKINTDKLPTYEIVVDDTIETGIRLISIVENPAIEVKGMAFSDEDILKNYEFKQIEDKQYIVGPALIPDKKIIQENDRFGIHYVFFTKETIEKMVEKFNRSGSNRRINLEHSNQMVDAFIAEDWIIEDSIHDKSKKYGFDLPVGTYMVKVKVDDPEFWKNIVRGEDKYSFSVEGIMNQSLIAMTEFVEEEKEFSIEDLDLEDLEEIYQFIQMAEIGERGGLRPSKKAPKSDTPNKNPKGEGTAKGDASSTRGAEVSERVEKILEGKVADFNERYKEKLGFGVDKGMLKAVYQRGVGAFNVSHSPRVQSAEQWALARVNAFLYLVKNGRPENNKYDGDNDLLPKKHKKRVG